MSNALVRSSVFPLGKDCSYSAKNLIANFLTNLVGSDTCPRFHKNGEENTRAQFSNAYRTLSPNKGDTKD